MGVTEAAKIKILNGLGPCAKSAFFELQTQLASEDP
jgi:hypothetical protein